MLSVPPFFVLITTTEGGYAMKGHKRSRFILQGESADADAPLDAAALEENSNKIVQMNTTT